MMITGTAVTWLLLNDENKKKEQTRRSTKTFGQDFIPEHKWMEYIVNEDNYHTRETDILPIVLGFPEKKLR